MTPSPASIEDLRLIAEILKHDRPEAFGELIKRHQNTLMNVALRMLGNAQEAEDVVQQVFIEAYRHLAEFRQDAQFSTWLYSIILNRCRNHLRSRKRRQEVSLDAPFHQDDESSPIDQVPERGKNHDERLEIRSEAEWIRQKVTLLPKDYREIFELFYFAELPLQAIAERLGRPLNTVKVYLHRARKELYALCMKDLGKK